MLFLSFSLLANPLKDQLSKTSFKSDEKELRQSNGFFGIGTGYPGFLDISLGYRNQNNKNGFNTSLDVGCGFFIFDCIYVKGNFDYLRFSNPNICKQTYLGIGITTMYFRAPIASYHHHDDDWFNFDLRFDATTLAPQFMIGRQFLTKSNHPRFLQFEIDLPTLAIDICSNNVRGAFIPIPQVILIYGFMF